MVETPYGMVILVKDVHPSNVLLPIIVCELGMVILVRPEQYEKAPSPILIEFGMLMLFNPVQLWKAPYPILVTVYFFPL